MSQTRISVLPRANYYKISTVKIVENGGNYEKLHQNLRRIFEGQRKAREEMEKILAEAMAPMQLDQQLPALFPAQTSQQYLQKRPESTTQFWQPPLLAQTSQQHLERSPKFTTQNWQQYPPSTETNTENESERQGDFLSIVDMMSEVEEWTEHSVK